MACGAGAGCGGCQELVAEIVTEERHRLHLVAQVRSSPVACAAELHSDLTLQSA